MATTQRTALVDPTIKALVEALGMSPSDWEAVTLAIRSIGGNVSVTRVRLVMTSHQPGHDIRADLAKLACRRWVNELEGASDRKAVHAQWAHLVQAVMGIPAIATVWMAATGADDPAWSQTAAELRAWVEAQRGVILPKP